MNRLRLVACTVLFVCSSQSIAGDAVDFSRDIQPIFQQRCAECHSQDESNGSLSFDDRASLFAEADSGEHAVVPGKPNDSQLLVRVRSTDEADQMPPEGPRLSAGEIKALERWIEQGANWPEPSEPASPKFAESDHWSFQPLSDTPLPPVAELGWSRHAMDRFIQARRESAGLKPAPDAEPEALIRRVTYSLTGLPPTPSDVRDFVAAAESPLGIDVALAALVDRLLNRPEYGERWGRHWMDWVRYADTAGDNSDYPIPQAYLYRNYIIDSLNEDLPYDQFLIEQIAGDLLPAESHAERNRQLVATGYLAMARRFGSLVERYPWHLTIEDTIDNMGRTMLGLTLACARCHDHKFDPISTRDYYGLYGIFDSTQYPFPGIELFQTQRDFVALVPEAEAAEVEAPYRATTEELTVELERLLGECEQQALKNAAAASRSTIDQQRQMGDKLDAMLLKARKAGEKLAAHLKTIPAYPTAYAVQERDARNARIHIKGEPERLGAEVARKFPDVLGGQRLDEETADSTSGRLPLAQWIASPENPLTARVIVNRVWQRHFGVGLVPTASDFGLRGEPPSHPELLDWLAADFMRHGWSLKHLHRTILNSRTYRLASSDLEQNLAIDPGNRLYWKFNRQRLDAESIRDTLLVLARSLDPSMQREPHPFPDRDAWKFTQHHPFKDDYASNRRSVYLMTKRLTAQRYFQTFDGPDPNVCTSDRDQSVTALQALYFVNDDFLHEQAGHFAEHLLQDESTTEHRLEFAFRRILCRAPTSQELEMLEQHLTKVLSQAEGQENAELEAWSSLTRSLMRLNEFLYID